MSPQPPRLPTGELKEKQNLDKNAIWKEWDESEKEIRRLREALAAEVQKNRNASILLMKIVSAPHGIVVTRRESEILEIFKASPGISNKEIGGILNISERTVKFHISSLLQKYGVRRRHELTTRYFK